MSSREASQGYVVVLEVEYDAQTEREARSRALRDASYLIQQPDVLSVTADAKKPAGELFPVTKAYLADGQMDIHDCIAEAERS